MIGPLWGELWLLYNRLRGKKKIFKVDPNLFLFFKSYKTLKFLLIIDFPKFDPLTAAEMALCLIWANMSKFIPLSLRLSGIEFSLV